MAISWGAVLADISWGAVLAYTSWGPNPKPYKIGQQQAQLDTWRCGLALQGLVLVVRARQAGREGHTSAWDVACGWLCGRC
eukprot:332763-Chlamydomonas_euryale.AAC.10